MAEPTEGLWLTVADLARERGITRQSAGERVARLVRLGRLATRPGKGRSVLVNLAEFDRAAGDTVDAVRSLNGRGDARAASPAVNGGDPVLAREQARRAAYQADNAALDLAERRKELTLVSEVVEAGAAAVTTMRAAYALAINDAADAISLACGCESVLIRPHLRKLERTALDAFVSGVEELRKLGPVGVSFAGERG